MTGILSTLPAGICNALFFRGIIPRGMHAFIALEFIFCEVTGFFAIDKLPDERP